jgi:hypothetical protein
VLLCTLPGGLEDAVPLEAELLRLRLRRVLVRLGFPAPDVSVSEGPLPAKPAPFRRLWPDLQG